MNLEIQRFFFPVSEKLPELAIQYSTAKNWIKFGVPDVVSIPELDFSASHLILENERLKNELAIGNSKHDLALASGVFPSCVGKTNSIVSKRSKTGLVLLIK